MIEKYECSDRIFWSIYIIFHRIYKIAGTLISIFIERKNQITNFSKMEQRSSINDDKLSNDAFLTILSMSLYLFLF